MAGHPGLSGQNAQLHVVWAPSREAGHVMRPATPVVVLLSRRAHVAWLNVTVEVRKYIISYGFSEDCRYMQTATDASILLSIFHSHIQVTQPDS